MTNILRTSRSLRLTTAAFSVLLASSSSALAQSTAGACEISLGYAAVAVPPVVAPTAVPGLTLLGVGILGALFAAITWRNRHKGGFNRLMSVVMMTGAAILSVAGGDSLVNVVRAAGPYEFSSSTGGTVADTQVPYANPAPILTVTNTSGGRIKITANGNASETGTCAVDAELAPGASCTTQAFACTPPTSPPEPVLLPITVTTPPFRTACENNTLIATYPLLENQTNNGLRRAFLPTLDPQPVFDIPGVTVTTTYVANTTTPVYTNGNLSNPSDLTSGILSVTATAPAGYGFGPQLTNTMTWELPYSCGISDTVII